MPEEWSRAVAVAAHPDDLEYGVASAVARWSQQGKEISYVIVTSGEAGIDAIPPAQAGPLREEEERAGAAAVGVRQVEFLGHTDGTVEAGPRLRYDLAGAFRRLRPEIVVTMNFDLTWGEEGNANHPDHRATGLSVLDASRDAGNRWVFPEAGEPWDRIREVYVFGAERPTHFIDVSETLEAGVTSLRAHRAYLEGLGGDFDPDGFLRGLAGFAGMSAGCEYAVTFRRFVVG
jgi:LmbE family N-acetylglucosaminyl deacetylase